MAWVTAGHGTGGVLLLDLERGESLGRFGLDSDVGHLGQAGAAVRPGHETADVLVWSLEDRFDPAVREVAHPSGHAATLGQPTAGIAEENALDPAGDQHPIANHKETVRRAGGHDRCRGGEPGFVRYKNLCPDNGCVQPGVISSFPIRGIWLATMLAWHAFTYREVSHPADLDQLKAWFENVKIWVDFGHG